MLRVATGRILKCSPMLPQTKSNLLSLVRNYSIFGKKLRDNEFFKEYQQLVQEGKSYLSEINIDKLIEIKRDELKMSADFRNNPMKYELVDEQSQYNIKRFPIDEYGTYKPTDKDIRVRAISDLMAAKRNGRYEEFIKEIERQYSCIAKESTSRRP